MPNAIGPSRWNAKLCATCPFASAQKDRVRPQPGHGRPVARRNGQKTKPPSAAGCQTTLTLLLTDGMRQPNGYTEPVLHAQRLAQKAARPGAGV